MLKLKTGKYIIESGFYVTGSNSNKDIPVLWKQVFLRFNVYICVYL